LDILFGLAFKLATLLVFVGLASFAVYWALLRGYKPRTAILLGTLMVLVYVGYPFIIDWMGHKTDTWNDLAQAFQQICQEKSKDMAADKMPQTDIDAILGLLQKYFLYCFPAWMVAGALLTGFLSYYFVSAVASRFTGRITAPVPFWQWAVPEPFIFGLILAGGLKLFAGDNARLDIVANNLLVLFVAIYTFAGLTITSYYFRKWFWIFGSIFGRSKNHLWSRRHESSHETRCA